MVNARINFADHTLKFMSRCSKAVSFFKFIVNKGEKLCSHFHVEGKNNNNSGAAWVVGLGTMTSCSARHAGLVKRGDKGYRVLEPGRINARKTF